MSVQWRQQGPRRPKCSHLAVIWEIWDFISSCSHPFQPWLYHGFYWNKMGNLCYSSTQEIVTQEKGAAARNELWNDAELLSMLISVNNIPDRESSQALWKTFLNLEKCEIQRRPLAINLVFLSHYFQLVLFLKKIFFFLFC